jgi:hypothetical protein
MTATLINPHVLAALGNDGYTTVLLHMDGSDGATTLTDSAAGATAHTFTAAGNAQLDTAENKFGTASSLHDGTGDWWTAPASADWTFGSGDFTVDCWFNRNGGDGTQRYLVGTNDWAIGLYDTNRVIFYVAGGTTSVVGTTSITTTGWHHIAALRTSNTLKLFIDGVQEGGDVAYAGSMSSNRILYIGDNSFGDEWNGWIDEVRISKGVARWSANFTPPTAAYA